MTKENKEKNIDDCFKSVFDVASKINSYASTLDDDSLVKIDKWLSTGYYALNAIISADVYKGIPSGRITTLFGPSQSGKSLLSALLQKSAQDQGMRVVLFDSEFDKDGRTEQAFGVDISKVKTLPIETLEDLIVQSDKMLSAVIENNLQGKVLFVLDSLGALPSKKEIEDVGGGKVASDMGLRAKLIKSFYRSIRSKCALSKCPFLVINHEMANPNQMYESIFKEQPGGKAIEYFSTVMLYIGKKKEKQNKDNDFDKDSAFTKANTTGQLLRFFTQKNRCAIPHKEVECYLNFVSGIDPYSGLKPLLDTADALYTKSAKGEKGKGYNYYLDTGNEEVFLGKYDDWKNNKEIWEKHLLPVINNYVNQELAYKAHT